MPERGGRRLNTVRRDEALRRIPATGTCRPTPFYTLPSRVQAYPGPQRPGYLAIRAAAVSWGDAAGLELTVRAKSGADS